MLSFSVKIHDLHELQKISCIVQEIMLLFVNINEQGLT